MKVAGSVIVGRPSGDVFAYLSDPCRGACWVAGVMEARWVPDGALALGTTVQVVGHFLGERLESQAEVVTCEPDRALRCKSVSGPVPYRVEFALDETPGGVQVTERVEADVRFFRLPGALVQRVAQRQLRHDLTTLKDLLEAPGVVPPR